MFTPSNLQSVCGCKTALFLCKSSYNLLYVLIFYMLYLVRVLVTARLRPSFMKLHCFHVNLHIIYYMVSLLNVLHLVTGLNTARLRLSVCPSACPSVRNKYILKNFNSRKRTALEFCLQLYNIYFVNFTDTIMSWLAIMEYKFHRWWRICFTYRNSNPVSFSPNVTYKVRGGTCGVGSAYLQIEF